MDCQCYGWCKPAKNDRLNELISRYPIGEINDDFKFDPLTLLYRVGAGDINNEAMQRKRRMARAERKMEHWNNTPTFSMNPPPLQPYRRDPYHTGFWNPVMWSDYPKQPAWTVPLPKLPGPTICYRRELHGPCSELVTEHMSRASCPSWFPDLPRTFHRPDVSRPECNHTLEEELRPFRDTWHCPPPRPGRWENPACRLTAVKPIYPHPGACCQKWS